MILDLFEIIMQGQLLTQPCILAGLQKRPNITQFDAGLKNINKSFHHVEFLHTNTHKIS